MNARGILTAALSSTPSVTRGGAPPSRVPPRPGPGGGGTRAGPGWGTPQPGLTGGTPAGPGWGTPPRLDLAGVPPPPPQVWTD